MHSGVFFGSKLHFAITSSEGVSEWMPPCLSENSESVQTLHVRIGHRLAAIPHFLVSYSPYDLQHGTTHH